ncbi:MAG TPA: carbon-nitrogen hydrolase [Candidatus Aquilonibacter sp.]|nr:carbon-nitrogen hydrolase [Candidatus Aquilonibacter sp.]
MQQTPFTIAIVQDYATPDIPANIARAEKHIREAARRGAQIICLKELFNAPYFCKSEQHDRFDLAEPIPGPTTARMQALSKELGVVLVVPIFEREAAGVYRNSAAVIDADGALLGAYRKLHIPDDPLYYEKFYFTPGDVAPASGNGVVREVPGFKVWKTRYATIGVLICWDQWFPEAARIMALLGAQVLFYPTAIGWHPSEKREWGATQVESWRTMQRAHAIANGIYVASPNRIGHEDEPGTDGITFFGNSFIADPSGRLLASANDEETVLIAKCDPAEIESTRRNWPFLRDRRIDAYAPILQRYLAE